MWDEDSDNEDGEDDEELVVCPYCGEEDDCLHLLASVDVTEGRCVGGTALDVAMAS